MVGGGGGGGGGGKDKEKKMFVGVVWNCASELKLLLTALLFLFSLFTILQFLPSNFTLSSTSYLSTCISTPSTTPLTTTTSTTTISNELILNISTSTPPPPRPSTPPPPPSVQKDQVLENGVIKRAFNPSGSGAYNFILMSAYRGGLNTFAIMGLSAKPLHVFGKPLYQCQWHTTTNSTTTTTNSTTTTTQPPKPITTLGQKILTDWGYGRVYTVVVVNCTFSETINVDNSGGKLVLKSFSNGGFDRNVNSTDDIEALIEPPNSLNLSQFSPSSSKQLQYDYFYCGSPLFGNLSPQSMREWLAYHVRLFGEKSHFVIHDAGGVHPGVMDVLRPWMEKGYVTLQDIREQERFDGYYHNQFLIVNDCLHRYRFMTKWMFFFDVDEFIFVPKKSTIKSVLDSLSGYTQFTIEQMPMSNRLCLKEDAGRTSRKWGFEKLVYKDVKKGIWRDRKYAVQPRNVIATGVHMSQNTVGLTTHKTEGRIKYFHYRGTISDRREPCRQLINTTEITVEGIPYVKDTTMRDVAGVVKRFELKMIGSILQRTPK